MSTGIVPQVKRRAERRARRIQIHAWDAFNRQTRECAMETLRAYFREEEERIRLQVALQDTQRCLRMLEELRAKGALDA